VRAGSLRVADLFEVGIGIQAYCQPKHTADQVRERVFHAKTKIDQSYHPCLSGNDVGRYEFHADQAEFLSVGEWLYTVPEARVFDCPRILAQQVIWQRLKTCLVEDPGIVHYNSIFHVWSPKRAYSLPFLCGLLNSRLMAWLFPLVSNKSFGDKFPKLSHGDLCCLPVCRIGFTTPAGERGRLVAEGKRLYNEAVGRMTSGLVGTR
jgi:hypothetical protein